MAMESSLVAAAKKKAKKKGTSQGKQKIPIKKIEDRALRRVVFNKLRRDLFGMAAKLCATTGARIAIIVFSPSGRLFTFGRPSVAAVLRAFLLGRLRRPAEPEEVLRGPAFAEAEERASTLEAPQRRLERLEKLRRLALARAHELASAREEAEAASKTTDVDPVTATPDDIPARD
ncbi:agamous-like MADS-box protein AGL61 [Musa acuminata AAA Group]|uniref:agamous-like MADS-box protein AGL61 n=1 Tax=Musa acuminata AAA Group TaxID=214697 RepID=UPI0031DBC41A